MSFTKVAPAGIGTEPGSTIRLGDSLLHSTGLDVGTGTGVGVTIRQHGDATFSGIVTASAFFGDGSGLEGVSSSGIGTPLSDDDTSQLNKVYYVNQELSIGSTVTVNHPDTGIAAYTHYQDLVVKDSADFIVADGDTFIPDVLGINTSSLPNPVSSATGGRIRAGTITNAGANGAPNFPNGLTGTAGTFTGNLNVGGVLTYEDVTNVDAIGIITARSGINVSGGNVKIGTTTEGHVEGDDLTIATSGVTGMTIRSGTGSAGNIFFSDATSGSAERQGIIRYDHADDAMKFNVNNAERLRITSDGKMGLGITNPTGKFAVSDGTRIAEINPHSSGTFIGNRSNHDVLFQINAATKAKIDTNGHLTVTDGNLVIGTNGHGIDFSATANATVMNEGYNTTAPTMDNELLKSYERGTWTGNIRGYDHAGGAGWGNVATTAGTNSATGRYIKIGNLVHAFIRFTGITWDTSWTYFSIVGIPFGHNHYDGAGGFCLAHDTNFFTNTGMTVMGNVWGGSGNLVGQKPTGTTNLTLDTSNSNRQLYATMIFYTSTGG